MSLHSRLRINVAHFPRHHRRSRPSPPRLQDDHMRAHRGMITCSCITAKLIGRCLLWVISVISRAWTDVRCYPQSDRDSDTPNGRQVPKAAKVQRSKIPTYSITSSARASSAAGIVSSSAFAVLRLMTSSYLVGSCTGKSFGLSPRRMRSAYCADCLKRSAKLEP